MYRPTFTLLLLAVLIFLPSGAVAQKGGESVDDLRLQFEKSSGAARTQFANSLMVAFFRTEEIDTLIKFTPDTPRDTINAYTYYYLAEHYNAESRFQDAIDCGEQGNQALLRSHNLWLRSDCLSIVAIANMRCGNFQRAIQLARQCYDIDHVANDRERLSSDLNNLAAMFLAARQLPLAEEYILKAIDMERPLSRPSALAVRYGIASEIFMQGDKHHEALDYARQAYELEAGQPHPDSRRLGIRLSQMAGAYLALGEAPIALDTLRSCIPLLEEAQSLNSLTIAYTQMGEGLLAENQPDMSLSHLNRALQLAQQTGNRMHELKARRLLFRALKESNPLQAMQHLEVATQIGDSIYRTETAQLIGETSALYRNDELQDQNDELSRTNRLFLVSTIVIAVLFLVSLVLFIYSLRVKRRSDRLHAQLQKVSENFFTNITDEFNIPLTAILGLGHDLQNATANSIDHVHEAAATIVRQGNYLLELINQQNELASQSYGTDDAARLRLRVGQLLNQWQVMRRKYLRTAASPEGLSNAYEMTADDRQWINRLIDLVHQQMRDGVVSLDQLAADMHNSRSQLNRRIQRLTSENSATYVMHIRLSHAKRLLDQDLNLPVGDVAMRCGFDDVAYFSRIFKKTYGLTPSQFRRRVQ